VFSLKGFCSFVDSHRPLQLSKIVSIACYAEGSGCITHRFLVIEVRMPGRETIWLRLDRTMARKVSSFQLVIASGATVANDMVCTD